VFEAALSWVSCHVGCVAPGLPPTSGSRTVEWVRFGWLQSGWMVRSARTGGRCSQELLVDRLRQVGYGYKRRGLE
jgi:hypothetical protein